MIYDPTFDEAIARKAISSYISKAHGARMDAGFSGAWHDGGASDMEREAQAYLAGLERRYPDFLKPIIKEIKTAEDPEYSEYMRLKAKFNR